MNIFSRITARTMRSHKSRTLVTVIGVILSTAMITAVSVFGYSIWGFLLNQTMREEGAWHGMIGTISQAEADEIVQDERIADFGEMKEMGFAESELLTGLNEQLRYLCILSLEDTGMMPVTIETGRMPVNSSEILLPYYIWEQLRRQISIGDVLTLEIGSRYYQGEYLNRFERVAEDVSLEKEEFSVRETREYTIVGLYTTGPVAASGVAYSVFCGPANEPAESVDVYFTLKNPQEIFDFMEDWEGKLGEGSSCQFHAGLLRWLGIFRNSNFLTVYTGIVLIIIGIIVIASVSLIYNAFSISLRERTVQFGLLYSIGATRRQLRRSLQYEALFVSGIGIPLGILSGILGIGVTLKVIGPGIAYSFFNTASAIPLRISWWILAAVAVLALVTILISVWIPSARIRRLSPIEAIRGTADVRISPRQVRTGRLTARLSFEGRLAMKNYQRDRKKYRSTILSLTLSIVLFVSVSLLGQYIRNSASFVLTAPEGVELSYSVYLNRTEEEKQLLELFEAEETVQDVNVYRIFYSEMQIEESCLAPGTVIESGMAGPLVTMLILSDEEFREMAREQGIREASYFQEAEVPRAVVCDTYAYKNPENDRYEKRHILSEFPQEPVSCGTTFDEQTQSYTTEFREQFRIQLGDSVSALPDNVVPTESAQLVLILPQSVYEQDIVPKLGETETYVDTVYAIRTTDYQTAYKNLQECLKENLFHAGNLINRREAYDRDRGMMLAVSVLSYGFIVLVSLVAAANIFNSVSTNLFMRRREFAVLRSIGLSEKSFRRMLAGEGMIYVVRSTVYGIVCSVMVSYLIWLVLNKGVDTSFLFPVRLIVIAVGFTFLVVFAIIGYVGRIIKGTSLIEEIKTD